MPKVSIRQIKAARALLGWSQETLAKASGVSIPTVKRLEKRRLDCSAAAARPGKSCAQRSSEPESNSSMKTAAEKAFD